MQAQDSTMSLAGSGSTRCWDMPVEFPSYEKVVKYGPSTPFASGGLLWVASRRSSRCQ